MPREAYAVTSLRAGTLEVVVGVELRVDEGEDVLGVYEVGRAAIGAIYSVGTNFNPDDVLAKAIEAKLLREHPTRAYYIEVGHHSEVARPEYRYHVQIFKPWVA